MPADPCARCGHHRRFHDLGSCGACQENANSKRRFPERFVNFNPPTYCPGFVEKR